MIIVTIAAILLVSSVSAQTGLCPQPSGDFPNPSSEQCTTFFRCVQGQPNLLRCPANQRFDFLFRICRPQAQVDCNNQLQIFAAPSNGDGTGAGGGGSIGAGAGPGGALNGGLGGLLGGGGLGAGLPQAGLINFLLNRGGNGNNDGGGGNNNQQLALVAALGQLMNQRRAATARAYSQQQQQQQRTQQAPVGFNQQGIPLVYNPAAATGPFVTGPQQPPLPPPIPLQSNLNVPIRPLIPRNNAFSDPTLTQVGFGAIPSQSTFDGPQFPGIAGLLGVGGPRAQLQQQQQQQQPFFDNNNGGGGGGQSLPLSPLQLQSLIDLASGVRQQNPEDTVDGGNADSDDDNN